MRKNMRIAALFLAGLCLVVCAHSRPLPDMRVRIYKNNAFKDFHDLKKMKINPVARGKNYIDADWYRSETDQLEEMGLSFEVVIADLEKERERIRKAGSKGEYHTFESLQADLLELAATYSDICIYDVLGQSVLGRDLIYVKISDNAADDEAEPEIRWDANVHGDEKITQEVAFFLAQQLCEQYGSDPYITDLVDTREIFIFPCVNPDGMVSGSRYNANGVDCNRDYGFKWDAWGGSASPFSQPEIQANRLLMEQNQFVFGSSYHSGTQYFSFPWSYQYEATPDNAEYEFIQAEYGELASYAGGQGSHGMYYINGSSKDTDHGCMSTLGWTIELSNIKTPPASEIESFCTRNWEASLLLIEQCGYGVSGTVTDMSTGEPVAAFVRIQGRGWGAYADPELGDYHRYLRPGTYTLEAWACGYEMQVIPGIAVYEDQAVIVDFTLHRSAESYAYKIVYCNDTQTDDNNHTHPANLLGPPDGLYCSIGVGAYIALDMGMGTEIEDMEGTDFTVVEAEGAAEGYNVKASNDWQGPWTPIGDGEGTTGFDLNGSGYESVRYILITDDGDGSPGAADPGVDIDAVVVERPIPGCGALELDKNRYGCDDEIDIALADADLDTNPEQAETHDVLILSDTEPAGETVTLTETGVDTAEFQGSIQTTSGTGIPGMIEIQHDDLLQAVYEDADCEGEPQTVITQATADCSGPEISAVEVGEIAENYAVIEWTTDEEANSLVRYGAVIPPDTESFLPGRRLQHSIMLNELDEGTDYYFEVVSVDEAGNETIDDNGGLYYLFTTKIRMIILQEAMDTDPGWSVSGGSWEFGQPTGQGGDHGGPDPVSGYTGENVYGYNLNGDYTNYMPEYHLTTGALDCSQGTGVQLEFYRWLGVEQPSYDHAKLSVSNNGVSWNTVWENDEEVADTEWTHQSFDISGTADQQSTVYIRWTMGETDSSWVYCGWNIDDVLVSYLVDGDFTPTPSLPPTLTPTVTPSITHTATSSPTETHTPTQSPSNTPTLTASPTETATPTNVPPTASPTLTPSPTCTTAPSSTPEASPTFNATVTPTPESGLFVDLVLNDHEFYAGDMFMLLITILNRQDESCGCQYIILDVYGDFWYWPEWTPEPGFRERCLEAWTDYDNEEILTFVWPENAGSAQNIKFWAAMVDPDAALILGNYDMEEFSFF